MLVYTHLNFTRCCLYVQRVFAVGYVVAVVVSVNGEDGLRVGNGIKAHPHEDSKALVYYEIRDLDCGIRREIWPTEKVWQWVCKQRAWPNTSSCKSTASTIWRLYVSYRSNDVGHIEINNKCRWSCTKLVARILSETCGTVIKTNMEGSSRLFECIYFARSACCIMNWLETCITSRSATRI